MRWQHKQRRLSGPEGAGAMTNLAGIVTDDDGYFFIRPPADVLPQKQA